MRHSKKWALAVMSVIVLCISAGAALGASSTGQWSGTVASVSGDDLTLVGVPDHFRLAGSVTELLSGRSLSARDLAPGSSVTLRVGEREQDGRFRTDQAVLQPKNPLAVTGSIGRIADDRRHVEVHGVEVEVDDQTAFTGRSSSGALRSARDLRAGATVRVTLESTPAGALRASQIATAAGSTEPGEDQEVKGTVTAVSDVAWTIDARVFAITDQTVFIGDPGVGNFVEVKFHTAADGSLVADRIHTEDDLMGIEVEFMGIVEAVGDASWTISGRVVGIDAATQILGSPMVGDNVEVKADKASDGSLMAVRIRKEDDNGGDDQGDDNGDDHGDNSGSGNSTDDSQGTDVHGGHLGGGDETS